MDTAQYLATGRRKSAVARVVLRPGRGRITVNGKSLADYLPTPSLRLVARRPLAEVAMADQYDVRANVQGGGAAGQSGAISLGIARALLLLNPELRPKLRAAGLLTRDSRMKERKKYGQKGARRRFQYSKR